jgi:hypothetical protein
MGGQPAADSPLPPLWESNAVYTRSAHTTSQMAEMASASPGVARRIVTCIRILLWQVGFPRP